MNSNQEVIENIKSEIAEHEAEKLRNIETAEKTLEMLKFIKEHLHEMIYKLQEVDETDVELKDKNLLITVAELPDFLVNQAEDQDLIEVRIFVWTGVAFPFFLSPQICRF